MKTLLLAALLLPMFATFALASPSRTILGTFKGSANDSQLSAGAPTERLKREGALKPDLWMTELGEFKDLNLQVVRLDHGRITPVTGLALELNGRTQVTDDQGRVRFEACAGQDAVLKAKLQTPYFSIGDGSAAYSVEFQTPCQRSQRQARFLADSVAGQAIGIWQIAQRAQEKMKAAVGLDFWKSSIEFVFPADADYYSFGQVHITRGDQWDVVGHEMGHAIYDLGDLGQFGGGEHKIDECYSRAMAISEGWASFFSAWVSIGLDDADAKFEYMVPRRAPLRIENIPADVCRGENNEWRVTTFFWDLIDLHEDGEASTRAFSDTWKALLGSRVGSASEARRELEHAGFAPAILQTVWDLNF